MSIAASAGAVAAATTAAAANASTTTTVIDPIGFASALGVFMSFVAIILAITWVILWAFVFLKINIANRKH